MRINHLGHVVLYVRDLHTSVEFYSEILGLTTYGDIFRGRAAVLTSGRTHHELLLIEVGEAPGPMRGHRIGLYHIGWCIGDEMKDLIKAKKELESNGIRIEGMADHVITQSLYIRDPDGNELELYVDRPDYDWKNNREWIDDPVRPLHI